MKRFYYILMTKCGKCALLKPAKTETIWMKRETEYVLAVSEKDVIHPVSGKLTMKANEPFLLSPEEPVQKYCCPQNPELAFEELCFGDCCFLFEEAKKK
jgi:hypothetical protein